MSEHTLNMKTIALVSMKTILKNCLLRLKWHILDVLALGEIQIFQMSSKKKFYNINCSSIIYPFSVSQTLSLSLSQIYFHILSQVPFISLSLSLNTHSLFPFAMSFSNTQRHTHTDLMSLFSLLLDAHELPVYISLSI